MSERLGDTAFEAQKYDEAIVQYRQAIVLRSTLLAESNVSWRDYDMKVQRSKLRNLMERLGFRVEP
jgi:hypothetical protein